MEDDEEAFMGEDSSALADFLGEDFHFEPDTVPVQQPLTMEALFDEVAQTEDHWASLFAQQANLEEFDGQQVGNIIPLVTQQRTTVFAGRHQHFWACFGL